MNQLIFDTIYVDGVRMVIDPPLIVKPVLSGCLLTVEDHDLNIYEFAETETGLIKCVNEVLEMLWYEYALEDPMLLDDGAKELQSRVLKRIKEPAVT